MPRPPAPGTLRRSGPQRTNALHADLNGRHSPWVAQPQLTEQVATALSGRRRNPYDFQPDEIAEPPRTFATTLRKIGPGLILSASIVGSGELIATTTLGAEVGFVALWLIVLSCLIKPAVQSEFGRYVIATGETGAEGLKRPERFFFGRLAEPNSLSGSDELGRFELTRSRCNEVRGLTEAHRFFQGVPGVGLDAAVEKFPVDCFHATAPERIAPLIDASE